VANSKGAEISGPLCPGSLSQIAWGPWRRDRLQLFWRGGIQFPQLGIYRKQLDQKQQVLKIKQSQIALQRKAVVPATRRADTLVKPGQFPKQIKSMLLMMGGTQHPHKKTADLGGPNNGSAKASTISRINEFGTSICEFD
jgi:hypothetical protein